MTPHNRLASSHRRGIVSRRGPKPNKTINLLEAIRHMVKHAYQRSYGIRNRDRVLALASEWRAANKEKTAAYNRKWYEANRNDILGRHKHKRNNNIDAAHRAEADYRRNNHARILENKAAYRQRNSEKVRRKARERAAVSRAKSGSLPFRTGVNSPVYAGGRYCFCKRCGRPLGWRNPSLIGRYGTFCYEHRYSWSPKNERAV
jgi:hypothetical protein